MCTLSTSMALAMARRIAASSVESTVSTLASRIMYTVPVLPRLGIRVGATVSPRFDGAGVVGERVGRGVVGERLGRGVVGGSDDHSICSCCSAAHSIVTSPLVNFFCSTSKENGFLPASRSLASCSPTATAAARSNGPDGSSRILISTSTLPALTDLMTTNERPTP